MFWGFLLGVLYLGTDNQLFQILHALCLWQKQNKHTKTPTKTSLGGGGKTGKGKKFCPNPNQRKITNRLNEWQPPRGTTFSFGYYLKRKHDNIHAKEIGDKICIQIWSLGFHSLIISLLPLPLVWCKCIRHCIVNV